MLRRSFLGALAALLPFGFFRRWAAEPDGVTQAELLSNDAIRMCLEPTIWRTTDGDVWWAVLDEVEQLCLVHASEGCGGAYHESDFEPDGLFYENRMLREGLRERGLLVWNAKTPEHEYDICGWYSITDRGREIVSRLDVDGLLRAEKQQWEALLHGHDVQILFENA